VQDLILYNYFRSSASYRVRIALELKNLKYEYRAVQLIKDGGEHNQASYRELNPMGEVALLIHKGARVGQSMAILLYLDDCYPTPPLFPKDPLAKAQVVQFCENINSGIHPIQNLKVLQELEKRFGIDQTGKDSWAGHWIQEGFKSLEKILKQSAGKYCFGNEVTAADCYLVPQFLNAHRFKLDVSPFPNISRICEAALATEAFKKAHPDHQPDKK
jgi:maleylacetoacetate isomerase